MYESGYKSYKNAYKNSHTHIINLRKGGVSVGHMTQKLLWKEALKAKTVEPFFFFFDSYKNILCGFGVGGSHDMKANEKSWFFVQLEH